MNRDALRRLAAVLTSALFLLESPGRLLGEDLSALSSQFVSAYNAGRYREAERIARQALAIVSASRNELSTALWCNDLAVVYSEQGRYVEAEPFHKRALKIREKLLGLEHVDVAQSLHNLAVLYFHQGRYAEAEPLEKRALAIQEKSLGPEHPDVANSLDNLANIYGDQGRYAEAEPLLKRALTITEKRLGPDHSSVAASLGHLGGLYDDQGRYAEAEALYNRALKVRERSLGPEHPNVAESLNNLAYFYLRQGRYAEAEPLLRRALTIWEKSLGPEHPKVAYLLGNLGTLYQGQGRYLDAEPLYKRALRIREKSLGPEHRAVAGSLGALGLLYYREGRYAEAEPLYKRALAIQEKSLGPEHSDVANSLGLVGVLYYHQGRYAEAEPLYKRALAILEKTLGSEHHDVAYDLHHLGSLYRAQGRYAEAEPFYQRALAILEKTLGLQHHDVATTLNNVATLYDRQGRYAEAEPLYTRALAIREKSLGPEHPDVADSLRSLAGLCLAQDRYAEAESFLKRALAIVEKSLGPDHLDVAGNTLGLALVEQARGHSAEAERWIERAITLADRGGMDAGFRSRLYGFRARLSWQAARKTEAVADLREALRLADEQRGQASGGELERAAAFANYGEVYERMVAWQSELGDVGEALAAIERSRGRSLLDELRMAGADFGVGRSAAEREQLRQQEAALKQEVAGFEKQSRLAAGDPARADRLRAELAAARRRLYEHDRDARASSPVYRALLNSGTPPRISQVQRRLIGEAGLLLVYLFGESQGYLMAVGPKQARLVKLELGAAEAKALGVEAGPLTAERLRGVLLGRKAPGVLARLADPNGGDLPPRLAVLWRVLVPEAERQDIAGGTVKRLIVVPDGPLALLPFEALVVEEAKEPKYLLDAGPAVEYGPSATVLMSLIDRRGRDAQDPDREPVLALGDPAYPESKTSAEASRGVLTARARYSVAGGALPRLPYSGWEAQWVAKAFTDHGIKAGVFAAAAATEAAVRYWSPGRKLVHLACHGLADLEYGNLYGALALAPGPKGESDPSDNGILTLREIYDLDLKGCELTILSACETNYGPQQKGEGTLALSRGFLIAGCRRVVASNWLVDDQAAASLVSVFCTGLARAEKARKTVNYAESLRAAKRWVRGQEKWKAPYYWASLVLIGPP